MATRIKPTAKVLHEQDFYVCAQNQAELLRERRFNELDLANLIEEVEDSAGAMRRSVRSRIITIMVHLLKLQYSPATDPHLGWRETVRTQRTRPITDLTPTLRPEVAGQISDIYARARHDAEGSLRDQWAGDAADALPAACPYTLEQITGDWLP